MAAETRPRRTRRLNWRQEYLHLVLAAMTICWLAAWVMVSLNWLVELPLSSAGGITALHLLGSTLLTRALVNRRTPINRIFAAVLVGAWLAVGLNLLLLPSLARAYGGALTYRALFTLDEHARIPAGPLLMAWVFYLWWRGYRLGGGPLTLVRVAFNLRLGLLGLLIAMLAAPASLRADLLALLPPFFFFGLLASSLARADSLTLTHALPSPGFGRGWTASLVGLAFGLTGVGYLLALWLAGINTSQAAQTFATLLRAVLTLLFIVASPVLLAAQVVFNVLDPLIPDEMPTQVVEPATQSSGDGNASSPWFASLFGLLDDALIVVVIFVLVLSVLALIWFLLMMRGGRQEDEGEQREALGSTEAIAGVRRSLRDRWRQLAAALAALRRYGLGRDLFTALSIRRIYAQMERLAAKRGYPRSAAETPYEYRAALARAYPTQEVDVQRVTDAYVVVRYGDVPEDPDALTAVREAWERLRASPAPDQPSPMT